jgi:hypothetical protein
MTDSCPVDLRLLRGMASFYARYTPPSAKKKGTPDLKAHLFTHNHRSVTEAQLEKAYNQCKRVRDLRDKRDADSRIRQQYEELLSSRGNRTMTRKETATWEEENKKTITAVNSLQKERLSEVDKVREQVVLAFEGVKVRGEQALKTKKAATEEEKTERLKKKAEKKERKKAELEAEKKRKEEEKAAKELEIAVAGGEEGSAGERALPSQ